MAPITSFPDWIRQRRKALDLTQSELAAQVGCAVVTIKKIEQATRRPSLQMAELLADALAIPQAERDIFLRLARHEYVAPDSLSSVVDEAPLPAGFEVFASVDEFAQTSPFVEREEEIARLEAHLRGAMNGSGRIVLICGEAGYGKTTLMTAFARHALDRYPDLIAAGGNCESFVGVNTPYLPFRDTLAQLTCEVETPGQSFLFSRDQARRLWALFPHAVETLIDHGPNLIDAFLSTTRLQQRVMSHSIAADLFQKKLDTLAGESTQPRKVSQHRLFEEFIQLLRMLAQRQPLLILLDDLQWIDPASAALLSYMVRRLAGSRILLLGSYRSSEVEASDYSDLKEEENEPHSLVPLLQELKRRFGDFEIDLDQTTLQKGRAFVDALLDSEPNVLAESFRAELLQRTLGHPLFTVELLYDMRERGDLVQDENGRWVQSDNIDWEALPARMEAVINQRISRLPPLLQEALKVASIEGDTFTAEVAANLLGVSDWEMVQLLSGVAGRQHRLVNPHGHQRLGGQLLSRYRFVHIVVQSHLYGSLDSTERAYLHEAVGNTLEQLAAEQSEVVAEQLAHHFQAAGLLAKAIDYLHEAGRRAIALSAHPEAIAHLTRALTLLAKLPSAPERTRLELALITDLGISYKITKGFAATEVEQLYRHAKSLCSATGEPLSWACVLWGFHGFHTVRGELAEGYAAAQECLTLAQNDTILSVTGHSLAGASLGHMGRLRAAQDHLEQARARYSPDQHEIYVFLAGFDLGAFTLAHFAHTMGYLGYPEQALRLADEGVELAQTLAHESFSQVVALSYLSILYQMYSNWRAAGVTAESARRLCIEHDAPYYLAWNNFIKGWALTYQERIEQGIDLMEQSLANLHLMQVGLRLPYYFSLLAEAYGKVGRIQEGLRLAEEASIQAQRQEQLVHEPDVYRVWGELLRLAGAPAEEVENHLRQALMRSQQQEAKLSELRAAVSLAQHYVEQGRRDAAQQILTPAAAWFGEGFEMAELRTARSLLGTL